MRNKVGELRPSQFLTTFGPGSIVDLPDYSVIMAGINKWEDSDVWQAANIEERRLKERLKIKQIKSIPVSKDNQFGTLPAYRFPQYHVCPRCRRLGRRNGIDFIEDDGVLYCKNPDLKEPCNNVKTHPVRFITACKKGHIQDIPWMKFVHEKKEFNWKSCKLYLEDTGLTGSVRDLIASCKTCDVKRPIYEAYQHNKVLGVCGGERPWLDDKEECGNEKEILLRGASNIYFSSLISSIVIPQEDNSSVEEVIRRDIDFEDKELVGNRGVFNAVCSRMPDIKRIGLDKAWDMVQKMKNQSDSEEQEDLKAPEYDALLSEQYNYEGEDFEVDKVKVPERYTEFLSNLVRVKRLKEVMVLKGFTRVQPLPDVTSRLSQPAEEDGESVKDTVEEAPISAEENVDWLPGVESYGEGIFLTINEDKMKEWENKAKFRDYKNTKEVAHKKMYKERELPDSKIPEFPGLRYVLLHTLSHALIRELTMHSGYSSSALKERIYSNSEEGMAGILIYTSTVDSEGSLGGLVELGNTDQFESIVARALEAAKYCSGDPQCAEQDENTTDVNGAACHSCMLISETSCEHSNRYLDRSVLVDTVVRAEREFFTN